MSLGLKLSLSLIIPLLVLTAVLGFSYQRRSHQLLRSELAKEGRAIALVVQTAAEDYLRDRQRTDLYNLIDQVTGYERVLGLRVFDARGALIYQSAALADFPFVDDALLRSVLRDRHPRELRRVKDGQPVMGFLFPLAGHDGRLLGAGEVLQLESFIESDARASLVFVLTHSLAMALATLLIVLAVTRWSVSRPIEELARSFRRVGLDASLARVPVRGDDELGRLASEFNQMCERLEHARQSLEIEQQRRVRVEESLRSADRLASLGRLAAGLAHEIGTPLNVISGRAEALRRQFPGDDRAGRAVQDIVRQSDRIVGIVRDMLDFARQQPARRTPTAIGEVVAAVLDLAEPRLTRQQVRVDSAIPDALPPVPADAGQLQQVFLNLVLNALDAMPDGGTLEVSARACPADERGPAGVVVTFQDTGSGIPAEHLAHVFDPFFTTKEPGQGTGLGLAVSYGIIEEHGGRLELTSEAGAGTRVTVHLPTGPASDEGTRTPETRT